MLTLQERQTQYPSRAPIQLNSSKSLHIMEDDEVHYIQANEGLIAQPITALYGNNYLLHTNSQ
jgi:hypothetical protein